MSYQSIYDNLNQTLILFILFIITWPSCLSYVVTNQTVYGYVRIHCTVYGEHVQQTYLLPNISASGPVQVPKTTLLAKPATYRTAIWDS